MTDADLPPAPAAAEEDVTTSLYRAAIGPVGADYYLPFFTRFEEADHAGITWNTTAALFTLHWLLFRQLYLYALVYVVAVASVVLLLFGIGRVLFEFPDSLLIALGVAFAAMAVALPGLFGNAVLHTECRKRMAAAVAANHNMADARAALLAKASTRRRGIVLAAVQAVVVLLGALVAWQFAAPTPEEPAVSEAPPAARPLTQPITTLPAVAATSSAPEPAMPATPIASAAANAPASAPATVPASAPASAASVPVPTASASAALPPASAVSAPVKAASKPTPPVSAAATAAAASTPASRPAAKASDTDKARQRKALQSALRASEPAPVASKPKPAVKPAATAKKGAPAAAPAAADKPYYINVGLFAVAENAERVQAKLKGAELPVVAKALKSKKGPLTRVRVGPFSNELEAQAAAEKIKGLQLDAVVVQP